MLRKFLIILSALICISSMIGANSSRLINQKNRQITELESQIEILSAQNLKLAHDNDSLQATLISYQELIDELLIDKKTLQANNSYKDKRIESFQARIDNLNIIIYILAAIGLISIASSGFIYYKLKKKPQASVSRKNTISSIPNHASTKMSFKSEPLKELHPINNMNLNDFEKNIKKIITDNVQPIYQMLHKSDEKIEINKNNLYNLINLLDGKETKLPKKDDKISEFFKNEPEKPTVKANSLIIEDSHVNNKSDFLEDVLNNNTKEKKVVSTAGTFEHLKTNSSNTYSSSKSNRVGSNPFKIKSVNDNKKPSYRNRRSRSIIPNSIHSCMTEYNNILRQINVGMMTENEIQKRIDDFRQTFDIQNLEYSGNGSSSAKQFSKNRYGNYFMVEFGNNSYLLPSFNETMDNLVEAYGFNGMDTQIRPPAVLPRQVIKFASLKNSLNGAWYLKDKGQLL